MSARIYLLILAGSVCAAAGQVMFKLGASGRESLGSFINAWVISGLISYALSTVLWIYSLSRAPLTLVYPFTALTFVFVYLTGIFLLSEPTSVRAIIGMILILAGLFLMTTA